MNKIQIILTIILLLFSCNNSELKTLGDQTKTSISKQNENSEENKEISPVVAMSIIDTEIVSRKDGRKESLEYSSSLILIKKYGLRGIIKVEGSDEEWSLPLSDIVVGEGEIEKYLEDRLKSTYSEGPSDGYSWCRRKGNFIESDVVNIETLLSTVWQLEPNLFSLLVFYSDGIYKFGSGQSGVAFEGTFSISDNKIILNDFEHLIYFAENAGKPAPEGNTLILEYIRIEGNETAFILKNDDYEMIFGLLE